MHVVMINYEILLQENKIKHRLQINIVKEYML